MILRSVSQRKAVLQRSKTIAMVGASANPLRPSYTVFSYLRTMTPFQTTPINPAIAAIDGIKAYPSLAAYAQEHGAPDIVDVFRKPSEVAAVVREAITSGAKCVWFQYGVINEDAIHLADEAGLDVVVDRCLKVENARLNGGLASGGLNSGLITSKRR
ncbi:MAG: CoA-binding protein [Candidatus Baltobacteraceae bacterium]